MVEYKIFPSIKSQIRASSDLEIMINFAIVTSKGFFTVLFVVFIYPPSAIIVFVLRFQPNYSLLS